MSVAAVIVTFNRKDMLLETLAGVTSQTHPVDLIILVNNASTDGTHELLESKGILAWPQLEYYHLDRNTGGAGGFAYGMLRALEAGADWIWTMDDDIEPDPTALEQQLKFTGISECINARKVFTENGESQPWEQFFDFSTCRRVDLNNASFKMGKKWCPVNVACFEGMLVSRTLLQKVQPPNPDYFILHDDTAFGIRASFFTNVIYVNEAVFKKKILGFGAVTPMRSYYLMKNLFRLRKEVYSLGLVRKPGLYSNFLFCLNVAKTALMTFLSRPRYSIAKSLLKGWWDGVRLRIPESEAGSLVENSKI